MFYCSGCLFKFPLEIAFNKPVKEATSPQEQLEIEEMVRETTENDIEVEAIVHVNQNQPSACYQCELCNFNVDVESDIRKHMDEKHGKFVCNSCKISFWDKHILKEHVQKCHVKISIKCKECEYTAEKISELMKHKDDAHKAQVEMIKCVNCEWRVKSKQEMEQHMKHIHGDKKADENVRVEESQESENDSEEILSQENHADENTSKNIYEKEISSLKKELRYHRL